MLLLDGTIVALLGLAAAFAVGFVVGQERMRLRAEALMTSAKASYDRTFGHAREAGVRAQRELEKVLALYREQKRRAGWLLHLLREERRGNITRERRGNTTRERVGPRPVERGDATPIGIAVEDSKPDAEGRQVTDVVLPYAPTDVCACSLCVARRAAVGR